MTLVNISNKIINVGTTPVLPSESLPITKAIAEYPAIKAFVEQSLIKIVDDGKPSASEKKTKAEAEMPVKTAEPVSTTAPSASEPVAGNAAKNAAEPEDKKTANSKKK